ncbi:MAG: coproporphyrinogen dehydrogenase HemZ, partial [Clostridia bacterium]|nr:coproporphyrinogen dehydrogenase HemZ [Clostridia bacterium]
MILVIRNHSFHYEMENLCRVFFPFEKIKVLRDGEACGDAGQVVTSVSNTDGGSFITVIADIDGSHAQRESFTADTEDSERVMAEALFSVLSEITGYVPPWGILTGVR